MFRSRLRLSGYALGFALGGFFDGILLHQILQWHHLLSGLQGKTFSDLRLQILADGLFHALMYVIAVAGFWLLWRARREFAEDGGAPSLLAASFIGFGTWHIVDGILSHWILGLHRIKMDSESPLIFDLVWFFGFGLLPLLLGFWTRGGRSGWPRRSTAVAILSGLVLGGGAWNLLPAPGGSQLIVWFQPGTTPAQVFAAAADVSANVVWSDASGQLWAFDLPTRTRAGRLYRHGAMLVGASFLPGCLSWSRARS
jgi:uncharacterized membrane protein